MCGNLHENGMSYQCVVEYAGGNSSVTGLTGRGACLDGSLGSNEVQYP